MISKFQHVALVVLAGILLYYLRSWLKVNHDLPPGPKPLPIVGNILDLPPPGTPEYQHWIKFKTLYGPISSITVLGTTLVMIHSNQAAHEILSKKSTKTSGRPSLYFADKMCGFGGLTPNLAYNSTHRLHRKLMHQQMGTKKITENFFTIQDLESRRFLLRVLDDPANLIKHIKTEASAIILRITYGYSIEPHRADPLVNLIERMMDNFSQALVPMAWPVDIVPHLRHLPACLPGMSFKRTARQWKEMTRMAADVPYTFVLRQMAKGTPRPSYVASCVEQSGKENDETGRMTESDEQAIKSSAAIIYGGGADTTVSTMSSFVLAMLLFPEVQQSAQSEIDRIVGVDRLPGFKDREALPYVNALIKETLRWLPVVPIGTTHVAEEEIIYSGYRIPRGAYLLPSIWWLLHDPETYPSPDSFDPERFLEPRNEPDPANHAFGYGRRICPGRHLADDNLFLTIARLLATFDITRAVDDGGEEIDVKVELTPGLIAHPTSFPYSIKPRSAGHVELIRASEKDYPWEESDAVHLEMDRSAAF
ncbi:O-methylsterigmatocystin oxidoreductase [Neonectria ditissima]|uniref:O-methylsterigmatocystin oxidoreductase n=1 Tax=Neonectria ditissima TaxID=78410 RepID=A0A0P7BI30_9HYPO|nr:O-methylsterigmatocystin oxidoreductase [Neonectria ditissima]